MVAVKTFDSTGVAPNGKLFAGDLNAIQAAAAAQADFAQTIDLGTLRIGDSTLSISKIGAGELQVAADLRVTKILRGLEGIIPGAFTTTQRDAIAAGRAPYGLAILNTVKNKWEWNTGTDGARNWQPFGIDSLSGTLGTRPAASSVVPGSFYYASDQDVLYRSDGAAWARVATPPAGATMAWFNSATPTGWVKYDGTNLPSSTGIYAELATHLGGVATPDTRGRVIVGQGTHAEVDTLLENDGLAVQFRKPRHKTSIVDPGHSHSYNQIVGGPANIAAGGDFTGAGSATSHVATGITAGDQTAGAPVDTVPHIVGVYLAKL